MRLGKSWFLKGFNLVLAIRARAVIAVFSLPLVVLGILLALGLPGRVVPSGPEWGYTLFSLGADIALVYLMVDFLLLREERERWKAVESKAIERVQSELRGVCFMVFEVLSPPIHFSTSNDEKMSRMRELLADPNKLKNTMRPPDSIMSSEFQRLSTRVGELQLRYSSRFDPRLIDILIDIENSLASISVSLDLAVREQVRKRFGKEEELPLIADVKKATWQDFLVLIGALVKAVDSRFFELPYFSGEI
jgi:hypothetical protein